MSDGYTRLSQQFDVLSKNFSEKTAPLVVKQKKQQQQQQKQRPASAALASKPPSANSIPVSQKNESKKPSEQKAASQEQSKPQSSKYESSKLTVTSVAKQSEPAAQSSIPSKNNSNNMKSVLTMSDDAQSKAPSNQSYQRPKSQSRLWSEHTMRTASQRVKKDEEKKQVDLNKQKWHYAGALKEQKSLDYFKTTRVSTCSYVQKIGDILVAKPFYKAPQREKDMQLQKVSLNAQDFQVRPSTCTSSSSKPLEPYNPNAARNILKIADVKMPHRNKTTFELSDGSDQKYMYKSLNKNIYGNFPKQYASSNPAIASDIMKRAHQINQK